MEVATQFWIVLAFVLTAVGFFCVGWNVGEHRQNSTWVKGGKSGVYIYRRLYFVLTEKEYDDWLYTSHKFPPPRSEGRRRLLAKEWAAVQREEGMTVIGDPDHPYPFKKLWPDDG